MRKGKTSAIVWNDPWNLIEIESNFCLFCSSFNEELFSIKCVDIKGNKPGRRRKKIFGACHGLNEDCVGRKVHEKNENWKVLHNSFLFIKVPSRMIRASRMIWTIDGFKLEVSSRDSQSQIFSLNAIEQRSTFRSFWN